MQCALFVIAHIQCVHVCSHFPDSAPLYAADSVFSTWYNNILCIVLTACTKSSNWNSTKKKKDNQMNRSTITLLQTQVHRFKKTLFSSSLVFCPHTFSFFFNILFGDPGEESNEFTYLLGTFSGVAFQNITCKHTQFSGREGKQFASHICQTHSVYQPVFNPLSCPSNKQNKTSWSWSVAVWVCLLFFFGPQRVGSHSNVCLGLRPLCSETALQCVHVHHRVIIMTKCVTVCIRNLHILFLDSITVCALL